MTKVHDVPYKIYLEESEIPKQWYNVRADMKKQARAAFEPRHPEAHDGRRAFRGVLRRPRAAGAGRHHRLHRHSRGDPASTTKCTAPRLDARLPAGRVPGHPAKIYYKFEGNNTSGSHKLNSAIAQAYYAKKQGLKGVTTETGAGQWGTALSMACAYLGLECKVYMVKVSYDRSPSAARVMRTYGATRNPLAFQHHRGRPPHSGKVPRHHRQPGLRHF